ncbi:hypothetical protein JVU11DRAFT_1488 [Chiua virens]|nr:hypothetical protein JVU11DRAFT_1488 [Chiua virens]
MSLFQRTTSGTGSSVNAQDLPVERTGPAVPLHTEDPPPTPPSTSLKPTHLYPIFTKVASVRERVRNPVINVDETEVIDITDICSDIESPTDPPLSSAQQLSRSEFSQATTRSPPPSPIVLDDECCEDDTSLPHAGTHDDTHPHQASKKRESNKRSLGTDTAPFPSSFSQHVRGLQHSYTCGPALLKRSVFPSLRPSNDGPLGFLTKCRQLDDTHSTSLDYTHSNMAPKQREEHLESLSRDYAEAHPAFARISIHGDSTQAEMWTRRFRPRGANEVLGNERQALYLRDWLRALELHLQDRPPEEPSSKTRENKEKCNGKRVEPRGVKRPRVIRAVTKQRGNKRRRIDSDDELDDFVVFSDEDEEEAGDPPEDSEDELAFCQHTLTRLHRSDATDTHEEYPAVSDTPTGESAPSQVEYPAQNNFADKLTNTLLITGPPGCGKTAAVYACAEELGWEVFEVYPGIGKRNGANLDHLVGDVGKNHIVQTGNIHGRTKNANLEGKERTGLRGYLARSKTGGAEGQPISAEDPTDEHVPLPLDQQEGSSEVGISRKYHAESDGPRPIIRQSLVLLEEVDILFKEDGGFWPAVVDFIRSCQRPVVMTCNDLGLVPVGDLPLQNVLVFEPCAPTVAATFLQCLSVTEGWLVPREDLMALYESTQGVHGIEVPEEGDYRIAETVPLPDLRRSITQLQILCAGARHGSTSEMHQGDEARGHVRRSARTISAACRVAPMGWGAEREWWRKMMDHSELMSHVDAQLRRSASSRQEVSGVRREREDEETGYKMLSGLKEGLGDELIAEEAIRHSRGVHEEVATDPNAASINPAARLTRRGFRSRVEYQTQMVDALQDIVGPAVGSRSVYLDYIPWVREMVVVDDELERRAVGVLKGGRSTRNSQRTCHVRNVVESESRREVFRRSRL